MKRILKNKNVIKAMSIGLSAFMGMATPISAFASEPEDTNDNIVNSDTSNETSSVTSECNDTNNVISNEIHEADAVVEAVIDTVNEAIASNDESTSNLNAEKVQYADDDRVVIENTLEVLENVGNQLSSTDEPGVYEYLEASDKALDEVKEAVDDLIDANNAVAEANSIIDELGKDYELIETTVDSSVETVKEAVEETGKQADLAESLAVMVENAQATEYANKAAADAAKQQALKDADEANEAYLDAQIADDEATEALEAADELVQNAEKSYDDAQKAFDEAKQALDAATKRLESVVPDLDGELNFEDYVANKAITNAMAAYNSALGAYNDASKALEETRQKLDAVEKANDREEYVEVKTVTYENSWGSTFKIVYDKVDGHDAILVYNLAYPDKPEATYYNYKDGNTDVTFEVVEENDLCIIRRTKTDNGISPTETVDLTTLTKKVTKETVLQKVEPQDTYALERAISYLESAQEDAQKASVAAEMAYNEVRAALADISKLRTEDKLNETALAEAKAKRDEAIAKYNQALEDKKDAENNVKRAQEAANKAAELAAKDFSYVAPQSSSTNASSSSNTSSSNSATTTQTTQTASSASSTIIDVQVPLAATPEAATPISTLTIEEENVALSSHAPSSAKSASAITSESDSTVVIIDSETALAASVPEIAEAKDIVKDTTDTNDKVSFTISDEETPLAAMPVGEKKISWWWLLIIAVLGKTGYELYKRNREKTLAQENNQTPTK